MLSTCTKNNINTTMGIIKHIKKRLELQNTFKAFKKKDNKHFKVAIFGSSRIEEGDEIFTQIKDLAKMLGEKGIDVVTGGGPGLMRAANEGHRLGTDSSGMDAHSIGIGVRLPWNQKFNQAVGPREKVDRFSQRLDEFMLMSNVVVVAPGGLGTLLELFYTWQLVQVHHICDIPIILLGDEWSGLLEWIQNDPLKKRYLDQRDFDFAFHAKDSSEAMRIIDEAYNHFKLGGKDFCLNYKMYKVK